MDAAENNQALYPNYGRAAPPVSSLMPPGLGLKATIFYSSFYGCFKCVYPWPGLPLNLSHSAATPSEVLFAKNL
jgi:hypothetical protein